MSGSKRTMRTGGMRKAGGSRKFNLKMILLGDGGVGKTSLVQQFCMSSFDTDYKMTVGVNVMSKVITLNDENETAVLSISDVAGQPRFEVMRQTFYLGAQIIFAVFDLTREQSLENLENEWMPELMEANPPRPGLPPAQVLLVGNKCDLEDLRVIDDDMIGETERNLREKFPQVETIGYMETSAKDNIGVTEGFTRLASHYVKKLKEMYPDK